IERPLQLTLQRQLYFVVQYPTNVKYRHDRNHDHDHAPPTIMIPPPPAVRRRRRRNREREPTEELITAEPTRPYEDLQKQDM
ncbi:17646_t:CDS:2, partial [Acaulospora morrowiae]